MRSPLGLLRRAPSFRSLFLATAGSSIGTLLAAVALTVDVKDRTESGAWVAILLIVEFLPTIAIGLVLGPLLDRLSRRRLMIAADLVRAAVFCALPFAGGAATIVALAAVAGVANGFFRPAVYAGVPNLVDEGDLPAANSLLQGIENLAWAAGPLAGGLLVAAGGPAPAYWVNAVTFLVSAALVAGIPGRLLQSATALTRGHWRDVADGMRLVRESRPLATVLVAWSIAMLGSGVLNVSEIFLAQDTFDAGAFGFGLLYGAIGTGLVVGSAVGGWVASRRPVRRVYVTALALMATAFGSAALAPTVWVAAALAAAGGVGNGVANVCNALLVQRGAPDELRGRAFTLVMSANFAVLGLGMALAGPLTDALGARWAWGIAAAAFASAGVAALVVGRGLAASGEDRRRLAAERAAA